MKNAGAPNQVLEIESLGGPQISFTLTPATQSGGNWLSASAPNGATSSSINIGLINPPSTAGTYKGTLTITPTTQGYSPVVVNVTLVVNATPPSTPVITSVENGASFQSGYYGNSIWTVKGTNLASVTDTWNNSIVNGELPTELDGVTVTFGNTPAYISYISPTQINLVTPNGGTGSVQVDNNGAMSGIFNGLNTGLYFPAFFLWPNDQVVATHTDYTYAAAPGTFSGLTTAAAKPGEVIILWGTGFGPTTPPFQDGAVVASTQEYATSTTPTVTINGVSASVYGAALAAGYAGLYQVAIQVPSSLPNGTWPIIATMGAIDGVSSPTGVVLTVQN